MRRAAALAVPALLLMPALLSPALLSPAPGLAASGTDQSGPTAQQAEQARRESDAAAAAAKSAATAALLRAGQADRLAAARVDAATALRGTEDQLADLDQQIAALRARHTAASVAAAAQAAHLAPLLPLAERLGLYPAETLLSVPAEPEQVVRGLIVLSGLAREVRSEIDALNVERLKVATMAQQLADAQQAQSGVLTQQRVAAVALDAQISEAARRRDQADDAATRAARQEAAAAARAETLRAAVAALEAARRAAPRPIAPPPRPPEPEPPQATVVAGAPGRSGWVVPVAGPVTRAFGAATDSGSASGVTYRAPGGARVVAPCPGRTVFAGPFRSYGQLLIVQCGSGLHAVLAGLARLDTNVGQSVRSGEPVGIMASAGAELYVEIRRAGVAINPALYLRQKG